MLTAEAATALSWVKVLGDCHEEFKEELGKLTYMRPVPKMSMSPSFRMVCI